MLFPLHIYRQPVQIRVEVVDNRECDRFNAVELGLAIRSRVVTPYDCIRNDSKVDSPSLGYV